MVRPLPIGVQDFKKVRDEGYLYVDKSDLIPQMLSQKSEVYQFTRPRRFGKSLNLSMLDAFFNLKYPKNNIWFDGLKVSDCRECEGHRNAYPVIYLDFKNLGVSNMKTFDSDLIDEMSNLFRNHKYLLDSEILDDVDKEYFDDVFRRKLDPITLRKSVSVLSRMLNEHHGRKVIILIDEYDNPIHNVFGKTHHQEILDSMRDILSSALKGNDSLQFGVVTGVMQIAKESIFSGLNNLEVNNVLSKDFDELFGFTDEEVKAILEEYGHPERINEAREWYDGYRFGDADVYNPWSLLNYVKSGFDPRPYWAGTSGNSIIETLLDKLDEKGLGELRSLSQGVPLVKAIDPAVTFTDLDQRTDSIYSTMVLSGYLKAVPAGRNYEIGLPNGEMFSVFGDMFSRHLGERYGGDDVLAMMRDLTDALLFNDVQMVESSFSGLLKESVGSLMLDNEHVYQAFITGLLLHLSGRYRVSAEFERGNGRYDIMLESRNPDRPHIVLEIKRSKSDTMVDDAARALEQIVDRDYTFRLKGDAILYGIAFKGKEVKVLSERKCCNTPNLT